MKITINQTRTNLQTNLTQIKITEEDEIEFKILISKSNYNSEVSYEDAADGLTLRVEHWDKDEGVFNNSLINTQP